MERDRALTGAPQGPAAAIADISTTMPSDARRGSRELTWSGGRYMVDVCVTAVTRKICAVVRFVAGNRLRFPVGSAEMAGAVEMDGWDSCPPALTVAPTRSTSCFSPRTSG